VNGVDQLAWVRYVEDLPKEQDLRFDLGALEPSEDGRTAERVGGLDEDGVDRAEFPSMAPRAPR
jgi:hypothetical protein